MLPLTRGTAAAGWQRHRAAVVCAAGKKASGGSGSSSKSSSSSKQAPGSPWASPSGGKKAKDSSSKGGSSSSTSKAAGKRPAAKAAKPGGGGFGKVAPPPAPPPPEVQKLTGPLVTQLLDELSPWEPCPAPLWPTWCGHSEGEWLGQYGAYTPWAGDPEPVWVDEGGRYLLYAFSRATAWRDPGHPAGDTLLRATRRGDSITRLAAGTAAASSSVLAGAAAEGGQPAAAAAGGAGGTGAEEEDVEAFGHNRDGNVVFDGGSYSTGPVYMGYEEEEEEEEEGQQAGSSSYNPATGVLPDSALSFLGAEGEFEEGEEEGGPAAATFLVEQVLALAGQERRRFVLTLKVKASPGEELGVEVARLLVAKEHWAGAGGEGAPPTTTSSSSSEAPTSATASSSSSQAQHAGDVVNIPGTVRLPGDTAAGTSNPSTSSSSSSSGASLRPPSGPLKLRSAERWDVPVIDLPRPQPGDAGGVWNCWVTEAVPLEEEDPATLDTREVWLYSAREERQQWRVADEEGPPSAADADLAGEDEQGEEEGEGEAGAYVEADGGTFWLPGGCAVTVRMVPPASAGARATSSSSSEPRGLLVSCCWVHGPGQALVIEREYDGGGGLVGVRSVSAVKGGWAGGRM